MVQTMRNHFEGCTNNQVEKSILDHKVHKVVWHPTEERFKHMVSSKLLNNYPINVEDITTTHTIFGTDLSGVQDGLRHIPNRVETYLIQIPRALYEIHKFLTLTAVVAFVNTI